MRDLDVIDRDLRLLAGLRAKALECGGRPSMALTDQLLEARQAIVISQRTDAGPLLRLEDSPNSEA